MYSARALGYTACAGPMWDKFHEECGVVGVYGHPEAATLAYLSLYALQHRGQESAGIVASNGEALIAHRGMGLVADIFTPDIVARLEGRLASPVVLGRHQAQREVLEQRGPRARPAQREDAARRLL